jgi:hypothetical protein
MQAECISRDMVTSLHVAGLSVDGMLHPGCLLPYSTFAIYPSVVHCLNFASHVLCIVHVVNSVSFQPFDISLDLPPKRCQVALLQPQLVLGTWKEKKTLDMKCWIGGLQAPRNVSELVPNMLPSQTRLVT